MGAVAGDAAGGLEKLERLKGRPVCAGNPDLGPCWELSKVLRVGLEGYAAAELGDLVAEEEWFAKVKVEAVVGDGEVEGEAR